MSEPIAWMPIREVAAQKFFLGVEEHIVIAKRVWDVDLTKEQIWEYAKKLFENISKEFPDTLSAQDLEYYHPTNHR